ncbi:hypothetical protein [Teichococcus vastitatis]|uniref:Ribbon-helix-helix protein, copG family n=1 Tax=Teichococcus vastitatis TaxID=2307076 RepID=A0ABS9W8V2_9PROT|nr:hypothetical protein [Pseudoroseomonas vastitatis]MCI0755731.1 hypothetical protein [Pseudoroseomonas vastitatis]
MPVLSISFPPRMAEALEHEVEEWNNVLMATRISRSAVVREAVLDYLKRRGKIERDCPPAAPEEDLYSGADLRR